MDVVPRERYSLDNSVSSREGECPNIHRVKSDEGSLQLDAESIDFLMVLDYFSWVEVDLFSTRLTFQLPRFFSWRPDPLAETTNAFLQYWRDLKAYVNLPWNLIRQVLSEVEEQEAEVVLITPIWLSQPWYPRLLGLMTLLPLRMDT